jgi:hypothetical protein
MPTSVSKKKKTVIIFIRKHQREKKAQIKAGKKYVCINNTLINMSNYLPVSSFSSVNVRPFHIVCIRRKKKHHKNQNKFQIIFSTI